MDDVDNNGGSNARRSRRRNGDQNQQQRNQNQHGKVKYMKMLQEVADRKTAQIIVELDDLEEV